MKIAWEDFILLGEVCYCRPEGHLYAAGIELEHCLTLTEELLRLASQIRGESQPAPTEDRL